MVDSCLMILSPAGKWPPFITFLNRLRIRIYRIWTTLQQGLALFKMCRIASVRGNPRGPGLGSPTGGRALIDAGCMIAWGLYELGGKSATALEALVVPYSRPEYLLTF